MKQNGKKREKLETLMISLTFIFNSTSIFCLYLYYVHDHLVSRLFSQYPDSGFTFVTIFFVYVLGLSGTILTISKEATIQLTKVFDELVEETEGIHQDYKAEKSTLDSVSLWIMYIVTCLFLCWAFLFFKQTVWGASANKVVIPFGEVVKLALKFAIPLAVFGGGVGVWSLFEDKSEINKKTEKRKQRDLRARSLRKGPR